MPFQPGRYTAFAADAAASAKAAHDRQAADLSARRAAPGPFEGLGRIPAAKWVFRTILVGAAVALAVDYLNTPLKPWLQYQAKIPGVNQGKSVAQVAAEEAAAPQAKIENEINAPAQADEREAIVSAASQALIDRVSETAAFQKQVTEPTKYYVVNNDFGDEMSSGHAYMPTWNMLDDGLYNGIDKNLGSSPDVQLLPQGRKITPIVFKKTGDRDPATIIRPNGRPLVLFRIEDDESSAVHYGAMELSDYQRHTRATAETGQQ